MVSQISSRVELSVGVFHSLLLHGLVQRLPSTAL